jgi:hypothetical protein
MAIEDLGRHRELACVRTEPVELIRADLLLRDVEEDGRLAVADIRARRWPIGQVHPSRLGSADGKAISQDLLDDRVRVGVVEPHEREGVVGSDGSPRAHAI